MKSMYLTVLVATMSLISCSALNANKTTAQSATREQASSVQTNLAITPPSTYQAATPENKTKSSTSAKKQNVRHRSRLYGQLSGEWTIVKAGKSEIPYENEMPYLILNETQWTFYSYNGCNFLNGNFVYEGENSIKFESVLTTMQYCSDLDYEAEINAVIRDDNTLTAKLEQSGRETYLNLLNSRGQTVMRLRRHNLDFLNGQWNVTKIGNTSTDDIGVNIFFDVPELKVHGNSGCNYFNGALEIDPYRTSAISFKNMAVNTQACTNLDIETKFLVALEEVAQVKNSGQNTVYLTDSNGNTLLTLHRAE